MNLAPNGKPRFKDGGVVVSKEVWNKWKKENKYEIGKL